MQSQAPVIAEQLLAKLQGKLLVSNLGDANAELLRAVVDALRPKLASGVVQEGKNAGKIVGTLAKLCGGGGGGKPDLAQAGGKQPEKLAEALAAVPQIIGS